MTTKTITYTSTFEEDVVKGLTSFPKSLSSKKPVSAQKNLKENQLGKVKQEIKHD